MTGDEPGSHHIDIEDEEFRKVFLETLKQNVTRSRLMADLWSDELYEEIDSGVTEEKFRELYRIISFDILDSFFTILPPEEAFAVSVNVDHYMQIELLNEMYSIDIMTEFQREFVDKYGDTYDNPDEFSKMVAEFEHEWSSTEKDYLNGITPNSALEESYRRWQDRWKESDEFVSED